MALKDDVNSLIELYETCDPEQILKCMGVAICNTDLLPPSTLAMKVTSDKETTIGILDSLSEHTRKFVLAHELGHVIEHASCSTTFYRSFTSGYDVPKIEAGANRFAFYLLLSGFEINESFNKYDFVRSYGLPEELARFVSV
ncbi:ImmA/IrrE family metallo-endopeptidase [Lactobacillus salivarius]|uniref:ImmA/IrrE family metallo-endopeptidase n=1 Tax=Ligilactobacillus salivarius TaxID=1624 RepID=UPI00136F3ADB|nr:ImmA/IrrE family metallo-endopeptidase [Ligilactobacillus salivarius]